jgi:hypothetical protein
MNSTSKFSVIGLQFAHRTSASFCREAVDTRKTLRYLPFSKVFLRIQEKRVRGIGISVRPLLRLAALSCSIVFLPLCAQELKENHDQKQLRSQTSAERERVNFSLMPGAHDFRIDLMPGGVQSYISLRPRSDSITFEKPIWNSSPGTIQRMESAFYCNDTPFVDQVRLPLATLWHGRVRLVGFESDVTTANFVMGLPGQGALANLSAFGGNGFLAVHTPPSDQLAGIHMTFSWHGNEAESSESSGLHGIEHLIHASRGFLPFFSGRSDSSSAALP